MKKYFQQLLDKWSCLHDWKEFERCKTYTTYYRDIPSSIGVTLICNKCGKIKKIKL